MRTTDEIIAALGFCKKSGKCLVCPYSEKGKEIEETPCFDKLKEDARLTIISLLDRDAPEPEPSQNAAETPEPWNKEKILAKAKECVCGQREQDYGGPEDSFRTIANLWTVYHGAEFAPVDVAVMLGLLKVARLASNPKHMDSWVDLAGYAACGGEIAGKEVQA